MDERWVKILTKHHSSAGGRHWELILHVLWPESYESRDHGNITDSGEQHCNKGGILEQGSGQRWGLYRSGLHIDIIIGILISHFDLIYIIIIYKNGLWLCKNIIDIFQSHVILQSILIHQQKRWRHILNTHVILCLNWIWIWIITHDTVCGDVRIILLLLLNFIEYNKKKWHKIILKGIHRKIDKNELQF